MSTKSSAVWHDSNERHGIIIHAYKDMHEDTETILFEIGCNTCNCSYKFGMHKHLGEQLVAIINKGTGKED